ncbi:lipid kinase YegS [Roseomonas sp. CECT 9278]|nr:lipid kinase YegS [Roseomonas sp. CECT 9278]
MPGPFDVPDDGAVARPAAAAPRRAVLVLNASAGTIAAMPDAGGRLAATLTAAGYDLLAPAQPDLPVDAQIDAALALNPEVVFVAGGDGTLRGAARRIAASGAVLGVLPGGTMNRLAARLGLPPDPEAAARSLAGATVARLPMAAVNGEPFLYQAVAGRASRLVRFREMQRGAGVLGWVPLLRAALRLALRPPGRSLRLLCDSRPHRADVAVVTVPLPDAAPLLQIEAVRRRGMVGTLHQAWCWIRGRLAAAPAVVACERPRLAVQGRARHLRVTLDGELHLVAAPLRIRLLPDGLPVLRPTRE